MFRVNEIFFTTESFNINKLCYEWFSRARNKCILLSGTSIKYKVKQITDKLNYTKFNASSGWLERLKKTSSLDRYLARAVFTWRLCLNVWKSNLSRPLPTWNIIQNKKYLHVQYYCALPLISSATINTIITLAFTVEHLGECTRCSLVIAHGNCIRFAQSESGWRWTAHLFIYANYVHRFLRPWVIGVIASCW